MNCHLDHKVAAGSAASLEVQNIGTVIMVMKSHDLAFDGCGICRFFFFGKLFCLPRWIEGCTLGVGDALYFCFSVTERVPQYENLTETRPSKLGISREKKETQQNLDRILNLYHYFGLGIFKIFV